MFIGGNYLQRSLVQNSNMSQNVVVSNANGPTEDQAN